MAIFKGAGVAIVTPFTDDYQVNYDKLAEIIDMQVAGGTDAIIICGTTGESATLSMEEHREVIKFAVEHTAHRIPVIAGAGSNCTETAITLSKDAEEDGADALLLVTPYYNKASQRGLIAHYSAVAEQVSLPIIMYNVPSRTGTNIQPATAVALAKSQKNIAAIKEASGNLSQIAELMALADGCIDLYSGNDDQTVPILSLGGIGVISVLSNVAPKQAHDIVETFLSGDIVNAARLQLAAVDIIKALFCDVNPIPVKEAMNQMGLNVGPCRLPLCDMDEAGKARVRQSLINYGIAVK